MKKIRMMSLFITVNLLLCVIGCGSGEKSELPNNNAAEENMLKLPKSISLELSDFNFEPNHVPLMGFEGTFTTEVQMGISVIQTANAILTKVLSSSGLGGIDIPSSEVSTSFSRNLNNVGVFKVDFASLKEVKFDINHDASDEVYSCSGNSVAVPICAYVWLNEKPYVLLVLTALPTDTSNGAGFLIVEQLELDADTNSYATIEYSWDFTNSSNQVHNIYLKGNLSSRLFDISEKPVETVVYSAHFIYQKTEIEGRTHNLINGFTSLSTVTQPWWGDYQYIVKWTQGNKYALYKMNSFNQTGNDVPDFICIDLPSANEVAIENCAGVIPYDGSFLNEISNFAIGYPLDFPYEPTF